MAEYKNHRNGKIAYPYGSNDGLKTDSYGIKGESGYVPAWMIEGSYDWEPVVIAPPFSFLTDDGVIITDPKKGVYASSMVYMDKLGPYSADQCNRDDWKFFSTERALDEYLVLHKPMIALIDIINKFKIQHGSSEMERMKELAYSKLRKI